jgi:hypothetical protein
MPIAWGSYETFDWAGSRQEPMTPAEREETVSLAAEILGVDESEHQSNWGDASPPGRFAATVIRVATGLEHRYSERARVAGFAEIGVKLFKANSDALREARRVVPFHGKDLARLPGWPNAHVQQSLDAGWRRDPRGKERAYVVQQWVAGESLEDLLRRHWPREGVAGNTIRSILAQLLGEIVIPLWARGTLWWDFRDANVCHDASQDRLTLIDVDSLGAYAEEILETPHEWARRDKGRATALSRLRQMSLRLLLAPGRLKKKAIENALSRAWVGELEPVLLRLGHDARVGEDAPAALNRFLEQLEPCFAP